MTAHSKVDRFFVGEKVQLIDHVMKIPGFVYHLDFSGETISVRPTVYPDPGKILSSACYLSQHRRRRFRTKVIGSTGPEQLCDFLRDDHFLIEVIFYLDGERHEVEHGELDNEGLVHFEVGSDPTRLISIKRERLLESPKLAEYAQLDNNDEISFIKLDRDVYSFMSLANYLNGLADIEDLDWYQVKILREEAKYFGFDKIVELCTEFLISEPKRLQKIEVIAASELNRNLWTSYVPMYVLAFKSVQDEDLELFLRVIDTRHVRLTLVINLKGTDFFHHPIRGVKGLNSVRKAVERIAGIDPIETQQPTQPEKCIEPEKLTSSEMAEGYDDEPPKYN